MTNSTVPNSDLRLFYVVTYKSSDSNLQGFVIDPTPQQPFLVRTFTEQTDAEAHAATCAEQLPYVGDASITYEVVPFGLSSPLPAPSTTSVVYLIEFWHDDTPGNRRFVTDENTMQVWATTDYTLAREDADRRQTRFVNYTYEVVTINVPGLALPFDPTLIQQRDEARRDLQASEAILAVRDGELAEQRERIMQLAREVEREQERHRDDIALIGARMIQKADEHSLCHVFDNTVGDLNNELYVSLPTRNTSYDIVYEYTVRVRHSITARDSSLAWQNDPSPDVSEVIDAIREGDYEETDHDVTEAEDD